MPLVSPFASIVVGLSAFGFLPYFSAEIDLFNLNNFNSTSYVVM